MGSTTERKAAPTTTVERASDREVVVTRTFAAPARHVMMIIAAAAMPISHFSVADCGLKRALGESMPTNTKGLLAMAGVLLSKG